MATPAPPQTANMPEPEESTGWQVDQDKVVDGLVVAGVVTVVVVCILLAPETGGLSLIPLFA